MEYKDQVEFKEAVSVVLAVAQETADREGKLRARSRVYDLRDMLTELIKENGL